MSKSNWICKLPVCLLAALAVSVTAGCLGGGGGGGSTADSSDDTVTNLPPTISGVPAELVAIDSSVDFTPAASDPDGDPLEFLVTNKPGWAAFDAATGKLWGTPDAAHVGFYSDIRISATDGINTATIAFDIEVVYGGDASVSLSWTPPSENEDGSQLVDLAGYYIYYGTEEGHYPSQVNIENPSVSSYVVENLLPGTYYFVATAYTSAGTESEYSDVASLIAD